MIGTIIFCWRSTCNQHYQLSCTSLRLGIKWPMTRPERWPKTSKSCGLSGFKWRLEGSPCNQKMAGKYFLTGERVFCPRCNLQICHSNFGLTSCPSRCPSLLVWFPVLDASTSSQWDSHMCRIYWQLLAAEGVSSITSLLSGVWVLGLSRLQMITCIHFA